MHNSFDNHLLQNFEDITFIFTISVLYSTTLYTEMCTVVYTGLYIVTVLITVLYNVRKVLVLQELHCTAGAYAGFLRGGPNFKISGILDIHAAKRHVASSEAASLF